MYRSATESDCRSIDKDRNIRLISAKAITLPVEMNLVQLAGVSDSGVS
jgi:hypothetical protein